MIPLDTDNRLMMSLESGRNRPDWAIIKGWNDAILSCVWGLNCGEDSGGLVVVDFLDA